MLTIDNSLSIEAVFDAYFDCRRAKRNSLNQLRFEAYLETNLVRLYDDLCSGNYKIGRSIAFIITHPKIREVWAADFRDRVVHHIIYNAISDYHHRRFIRDNYACIPGRGTHDGLRRISGFARSITQEWIKPAYYLRADVANFFNSLDKNILLELADRYVPTGWLRALIHQVALHDPRENFSMHSPTHLFDRVPRHKSLMHAPNGKGLPIGNLTSQFFANLYMNELDQFVKHKLKAKYYGRYVDDIVLFHEDPDVLNDWYVQMDEFLKDNLARGEKIYGDVSGCNRKNINLIMAQRRKEYLTPMLFESSCDSLLVNTWLEECLMPVLTKPSIVIMDNAPFHKKKEIADILKRHGHAFLPLPPYSPDFNPIEQTFGTFKKRRDYAPAGTSIETIIKMSGSYFKLLYIGMTIYRKGYNPARKKAYIIPF